MKHLISLCLVIFFTFCCNKSVSEREKTFMESLNSLNILLLEIKQLPSKESPLITLNDVAVKAFDTSDQKNLIKSRENDWINLYNKFRKLINDNSEDIWNDDIVFCLNIILDQIGFIDPTKYSSKNEEVTKKILNFQEINIEDSTKEKIKDGFWNEFYFYHSQILPNTSETDVIKYYSVMNFVDKVKVFKEYCYAKTFLKELLKRYPNTELSKIISEEITESIFRLCPQAKTEKGNN